MQEWINKFIIYLRVERNYAINTQISYRRDLQKLLAYCAKNNIPSWLAVNNKNINLFIMELYHSGVSAKSINRYLSAARKFFDYIGDIDGNYNNCVANIKAPKIKKHLPKVLNYQDIEKILISMKNTKNGLRDIAIIEVLYSCALRVSELVAIDIQDIDASQGFLKVIGKGGKNRYTPIGKKAQLAINNYLSEHLNNVSGALFLNNKNTRIGVRSIQDIIKRRALEAGIKVSVNPHMFRHTSATHFLQSSHDLRSVQEFLGHKSVKSTQVYTHLDFLELAKVYDRCHPRAKK